MGKERASAAQGKVRTVGHLLDRAQKGDAQALAELRPLLDQAPGWWDEVGNIAQQAEEMLVSTAAGENVLVKEAYTRRLATLREELAGPVVTPLERLLIDRVVACWFHLHYVEAIYAQALKRGLPAAPRPRAPALSGGHQDAGDGAPAADTGGAGQHRRAAAQRQLVTGSVPVRPRTTGLTPSSSCKKEGF